MKILVATGSSGGHIFPALSFIDTLKIKNKDIDILLVLPQKSISRNLDQKGYKIKYLPISPVRFSLKLENLKAIPRNILAVIDSVRILANFKPDIVVGFGSISSLPLVFFAWFFRINTLIHEQNVLPGKATRFLAKFSDKIAVSFEETKEYFRDKNNVVLTGNPLRVNLVRIDKKSALDFFGFQEGKFTILVIGGSQGSHKINQRFFEFVSSLSDKGAIQIIHLSGSSDYDTLKKSYSGVPIEVKLFDFLDQVEYAYSAADLVISRAGAMAITEAMHYKVPAILIPYPYAQKHQFLNAKVLEKKNCAVIIDDNNLNLQALKQVVEPLIYNPGGLENMRRSFDEFFLNNANERLVNEIANF